MAEKPLHNQMVNIINWLNTGTNKPDLKYRIRDIKSRPGDITFINSYINEITQIKQKAKDVYDALTNKSESIMSKYYEISGIDTTIIKTVDDGIKLKKNAEQKLLELNKLIEEEARKAAEAESLKRKVEEEADAKRKAEADYNKFKEEALNVLNNVTKSVPVPVEPVPVIEPVVVPVDHYEEFKCKALQHMQQILNNSLLGNLETNSNYNEFKLKAVQIMQQIAAEAEAKKAEEASKAKIEAAEQAAEAEKLEAIQAKAEAEKQALQDLNKTAEEQIQQLYYNDFKSKALEKMRDIQLAQESMNNDYATFVLKATAVLNSVATQGLNTKIADTNTAIAAASDEKNKLEQEYLYKEFKNKAEMVLIRSLTGDITKQLADKQTVIENDNYTEFKLKAQLLLTQALLNSQQQKYMEQQEQGTYEQFKSNALNVMNNIVAQQSLYDEFKQKALDSMNNVFKESKIQSLTEEKYYEEFKRKALDMMMYSNPELGSTEWVSAL